MKKYVVCVLFFITGPSLFSQSKKHVYANKDLKAEYHTKNGMMDGKYVSHYANGKKKSEGYFKDNLREGKWNIWDSTGKIHYEYKVPADSFKRNTNGYIDFMPLREMDVLLEKRTWRDIFPTNNPLLFSHTGLFDTLYKYIQSGDISVFKEDEYINELNKEGIQKKLSPGKYDIASFKIKEDWFFDKKTGAARSQVIGLYPILKPRDSESEENIALGWLYYPQLRKYLAKEKSTKKGTSITSLDDIFYFNHFHSQIYKENNVYDRSIATYEKTEEGIAREAERIELSMIEMEHDFWIKLKKP